MWYQAVNRARSLQRRAPYQARKGRCSTLNCCMSLSLDRGRFKETCSSGFCPRDIAFVGPCAELRDEIE
ncbi:hypothetical protein CO661_08330 [Sinorhizobium fredii]|uniref:Uncharacterized protein n=1 Tax=Rhizobium fredii TaxID=380 RepID=A0A2A6M122_RHIFR|nr:hypothetical protein CO661_08330 [Sinorhizobium fredii]